MARPFDYARPTGAELEPFIGKLWVVGRNTAAMRARYPGATIVSPAAFARAEAKVIEARGYAREAEKVILDLVATVKNLQPRYMGRDLAEEWPEIVAARRVLAEARVP